MSDFVNVKATPVNQTWRQQNTMAYRKMVDKFVCSLQKKCIAISPEKTRKREQREKEATLRVYKVIFSPKNVGYRQKERRTQNGRKWLPKLTCVC